MFRFTTSAAAAALLSASVASALTPVTVKGNAFFAGDERFYIRGIDYQPGGSAGAGTPTGYADPLADPDVCKRDLEYFKQLQVNTVRVYTVDNSADHDECMNAFNDAGIYLAIDVNTPDYSLNRKDPHSSYNDVYLQSVFATVDAFANYDNTLLFFSGNEVINDPSNSNTAPYIKAVVRDMKQYIGSRGYRAVPVGYSAADVAENREQTAQYLNCGTDDERSDFFSFNDYSWCDPSSYTQAGWDQKVATYKDYSIPLFLSEYGCITNTRKFQETHALYSSQMTPVYSGGLVYQYTEEGDHYGLVTVTGDKVKTEPDFDFLSQAFKTTPSPSGDGGYHSGQPSKCPPSGPNWDVHGDLLPAIPEPAKKFMTDGAGSPPGFGGSSMAPGTGTTSSTKAQPGSGKVTQVSGDGSSTDSPAPGLQVPSLAVAPFLCGLVVLASTMFGASML